MLLRHVDPLRRRKSLQFRFLCDSRAGTDPAKTPFTEVNARRPRAPPEQKTPSAALDPRARGRRAARGRSLPRHRGDLPRVEQREARRALGKRRWREPRCHALFDAKGLLRMARRSCGRALQRFRGPARRALEGRGSGREKRVAPIASCRRRRRRFRPEPSARDRSGGRAHVARRPGDAAQRPRRRLRGTEPRRSLPGLPLLTSATRRPPRQDRNDPLAAPPATPWISAKNRVPRQARARYGSCLGLVPVLDRPWRLD